MIEGGLLPAALMALQAALRILLGIATESKNKLGGGCCFCVVAMRRFLSVSVSFARTVAQLASGNRIRVRRRERRMARLAEFLKLGLVA
jgi:hypothetical protein